MFIDYFNSFWNYLVWRCNRKYEVKGKKGCENKHIDDSILYKAFVGAFNTLVENKDYFMQKWKAEDRDVLKKYKAEQFIKIIEGTEKIKEFDIDIYYKVIEKITVYQGNKIIVTLLDGTDVECEIE
jgi:site-specific DNA recombinase